MIYCYKRFCVCILIFSMTNNLGWNVTKSEEIGSSGAEYLRNAIRDIQRKNAERNVLTVIGSNKRIIIRKKPVMQTMGAVFDGNRRFSGGEYQNTPHFEAEPPPVYQALQQEHPPSKAQPNYETYHQASAAHTSHSHMPEPPTLTKGELASLYEAAVANGNTVQLGGYNVKEQGVADSIPIQAAIHEIRDQYQGQHQQPQHGTDAYYYYYYPLKTFLDGVVPNIPNEMYKDKYKNQILQTSHTHLHNVKVEPIKAIMEAPPKHGKALEPLFMAISGLVGMAVMFMFSMILLPRVFGGKTIKKIKIKKVRKGRTHSHISSTQPDLSWALLFNNFVETIDCSTCNTISWNSRLLHEYAYSRS